MPPAGIDGFIDTSLLSYNVMIWCEASGTVAISNGPNVVGQTGEFFISPGPGNYDLVITADGHATVVIAGVPVTATTSTSIVTVVSTSLAPITLPTSTMRTVSGTVILNPANASTVAFVASKQTFSGGPTVTVKKQAADMLTGAYSLSLPIAAPLLGQYGTGTLPIALTSQSANAGKYTAEASATGYQTQSVSADISIANVIQNFTLAP